MGVILLSLEELFLQLCQTFFQCGDFAFGIGFLFAFHGHHGLGSVGHEALVGQFLQHTLQESFTNTTLKPDPYPPFTTPAHFLYNNFYGDFISIYNFSFSIKRRILDQGIFYLRILILYGYKILDHKIYPPIVMDYL